MKSITVRKCRPHRIAIRIVAAVTLAAVGAMLFWSGQNSGMVALLCLPLVLAALAVWLYEETWQIVFSADRICKKVFWLAVGSYSYHEIKDVVSGWSYTDHGYIRIVFTNGKTMKFRLTDENAAKAQKRIQSHHSVRTKG